MVSKKTWILAGVVVAVAGAGAIGAHAYRGGYEGGYHHGRGSEDGDYGRGPERHGWGRGRDLTKSDFDERTRERFARLDANSDGVVDAAEMAAMIARRMEGRRRGADDRFMNRLMRRFDVDRDGKVTKSEVEARVAEMFARLDIDGDKQITDSDLPPMLRDRDFLSGGGDGDYRGRRGGRGMGMFRRLQEADANKDNVVTVAEMQTAAAKRFARFDHNRDGVLDEADRDAFRKDVVDYRVRRMLHRFGASAEGKMTFAQFKAHRDERFARMDFDGNGVLSRDERPRHRGWGPHRGGHHGHGRGGEWGPDDRGPDHRGHGGRGPRGGPDRGPGGEREL